jgi:dimethylaniline monooxygenase (N-oxide forming)
MLTKKRVAIIGAGRAGLCCAKYSIDNGLEPFVFDKSSTTCGLWSPGTHVWEGMYCNNSKYFMSMINHTWSEYPKSLDHEPYIFPSADDVRQYIKSYIDRYDLQKHITLDTNVDMFDLMPNKQWKLTLTSLKTMEKQTLTFDFVVLATGFYTKPRMPTIEGSEKFRGEIVHSIDFRKTDDPRFKNKKVIIVGCSRSGTEIATILVNHAQRVTSILREPYLILPLLVPVKLNQDKTLNESNTDKYNILPIDLLFKRRNMIYKCLKMSKDELRQYQYNFVKSLNLEQNDAQNSVPALYINPQDYINPEMKPRSIKFSMSDQYYNLAKSGQIITKRTSIKSFDTNGVHLEDGTFEPADVVLFCTGYNLLLDCMPKNVLEAVKYSEKVAKNPFILYKHVWHPDLPNFAVVGQNGESFFIGTDLEARWVSLVFIFHSFLLITFNFPSY